MKKILLFSAVFTLASVCMGQEVDKTKFKELDYKTATEEEYRAVYNEIIVSTNAAYITELSLFTKFWRIQHRPEFESLVEEFDQAFSTNFNVGKHVRGLSCFNGKWPNTKKKWEEYFKAGECYPKTMEITSAKKIHGLWCAALSECNVSLEEAVIILGELSSCPAFGPYIYIQELKNMKSFIQQTAVKSIKRKLREQGKSFVTKDGVNPCEEYLTRLNVALDAPHFAGLNAWLEELGFEARIDETKLPTPATVQELKDKVFYGEVDANNKNMKILYVGLGVDEYNKFVKEYNGEK